MARIDLDGRGLLRRARRVLGGDDGVTAVLTAGVREMFDATLQRRQPPPYTAMPRPPTQPSMP